MSITVHPITVDPDTQEPVYTAQDYRRSVNSLLFPSNGSTFNSLNCVSASSPTHVLTVSGSVVTVLPHSGFMSPFAGEAPYTYTITGVDGDNKVTMTAATGHYKIAVVVTDPSAGQGATPGASLAVYSSSTVDSAIPGIVLGEYDNGVVTDTAVRWQNQGVLIASSLTQLNTMAAVNGQLARVGDVEYERKDGRWVPTSTSWIDIGYGNGYKAATFGNRPQIRILGGLVFMRGVAFRKSGTVTEGDTPFGLIPASYRPRTVTYAAVNGSEERSVNIQVNASGTTNVKGTPRGEYVACDGCWWAVD